MTDALSWLESNDLNTLLTDTTNGALTSLMDNAKKGNPKPLTDALSWLESNALNTLLTTHDGVLTSLVEAAQEGDPQYLTDVLLGLEFNDLKGVFIDGRNEILDLFENDKTSEDLAWVLSRLDPDNLNAVLRNDGDKILNLLVEKGSSEPLAWVLFRLKPTDLNAVLKSNNALNSHLAGAPRWLRPKDLNEVLTTNENGVLEYLVAAAKNGNPQYLTYMFGKLNPGDLNTLLKTHDEILACLMEAARNGNPQYLCLVLLWLNSTDLNTMLAQSTISNSTDGNDTVLNLFVKAAQNGHPEYLASVLFKLNPADLKKMLDEEVLNSVHLVDALGCLKLDALNDVLTKAENGVLASLIAAAQEEHAEYLAWVLFKLNPADLKKMLDREVLNSEHLAAAFTCFKPDARNTLLTTTENGVLEHLKKTLNIWFRCLLNFLTIIILGSILMI